MGGGRRAAPEAAGVRGGWKARFVRGEGRRLSGRWVPHGPLADLHPPCPQRTPCGACCPTPSAPAQTGPPAGTSSPLWAAATAFGTAAATATPTTLPQRRSVWAAAGGLSRCPASPGLGLLAGAPTEMAVAEVMEASRRRTTLRP